jgi:predicted transcriptional regulator
MEELVGFIASNNKASKILNVLDSKGPLDRDTIAKTTRIVAAEKNLEELVEKKLLEEKSGKFSLTELGREVIHKYRGMR